MSSASSALSPDLNLSTILRQVPFFAQLSDEQMEALINLGYTVGMQKGQFVCHQGEQAGHMVVVLKGQVRVYLKNEQNVEATLQECKAGDYIGELALLDNRPRSASAACLTDCEFFGLEQPAFRQLLVANPTLMFGVLTALTTRVRERTEEYYKSQLAKQLIEKEAELERHRSLAQMVAGVAHELNTPLGVANTASGMIERRLNSSLLTDLVRDNREGQLLIEDVLEAARLLKNNIVRAHKLVENFKKISVRQLTDTLETVQLPQLIQDVVDLFKINARQAGLEISIHHELNESTSLWTGYPSYLTQVLLNFLTNIERYAYPGKLGGQVEIRLAAQQVSEQPHFTLTVRDFGKGIAPENLPHVFEPFFTTGRTIGGSGLGMAIVYNLVTEALAGTIKIESMLNQGTTVRVTLPAIVQTRSSSAT